MQLGHNTCERIAGSSSLALSVVWVRRLCGSTGTKEKVTVEHTHKVFGKLLWSVHKGSRHCNGSPQHYESGPAFTLHASYKLSPDNNNNIFYRRK